jgi:hypothetical protein
MGHSVESDVAEWVVRLSEEPLDQRLADQAERLRECQHPVGRAAGRRVISLFSPKRADTLFESDQDEYYARWRKEKDQHAADPCRSFYRWSDEECIKCLSRRDVPLSFILGRAEHLLFNPEFEVPASLVELSSGLLGFDPNAFRTGLWTTNETHTLDLVLPLLASRRPSVISDFVDRIVSTLSSREGMKLYAASVWLHDFGPLIRSERTNEILASIDRIASLAPVSSGDQEFDPWLSEAFLVLSVAPHLAPDNLADLLLRRPVAAHDLVRFQPWIMALSAEGINHVKDVLMLDEDRLRKTRALWLLGLNATYLSDEQRSYITSLVHSPDRTLKGAVLRFACLSQDQNLGSALIGSEFTFERDGEFLDSIWGPQLFVAFANVASFETLVSKLHPADAGFALKNRGSVPNEVERYAVTLSECISRITAATDPEAIYLPRIVANPSTPRRAGLPTFAQEDGVRQIGNPAMSWGGNQPQSLDQSGLQALQEMFDGQKLVDKQNRLAKEQVDNVFAAWGTEAYNWFGRTFSYEALDSVCQARPDLAAAWVAACKSPNLRRVHGRIGSFLGQLCSILLFRNPQLGQELWHALRSLPDSPIVFDSMVAALRADDSEVASGARWEALSDCNTDADLSRFAVLAELFQKKSWLSASIQQLIRSHAMSSRAKAMTIASFSNIPEEEFESIVTLADVKNTWIEPQVPYLRRNVTRNSFAQHWYRCFLDAGTNEQSWGGYKMLLLCGDERFFAWRHQCEQPNDLRHQRRLRFLEANSEVRRELDRTEERSKTLFGIEIKRGEVYPFISHGKMSGRSSRFSGG